MTGGPDVRALRDLLGSVWGLRRPVCCLGCSFSVRGRPDGCALLGVALVNHEDPPCTQENWQERARTELAALEADNALLAAVARDAREESSMYARGLAEGRAAEREACCRAVCGRCAAGDPVVLHQGAWCHRSLTHGPNLVGPCKADAVRRRAGEDGS